MSRWPERRTWYPWHIEPSDLIGQGYPELVRDLVGERQIGLHVLTSKGASLGLLAIRCERRGTTLIPLEIAIAETPAVVVEPAPAMDLRRLRGPSRRRDDDERRERGGHDEEDRA